MVPCMATYDLKHMFICLYLLMLSPIKLLVDNMSQLWSIFSNYKQYLLQSQAENRNSAVVVERAAFQISMIIFSSFL